VIAADVLEAASAPAQSASGPSLVSAPAFDVAPGSEYIDLENS